MAWYGSKAKTLEPRGHIMHHTDSANEVPSAKDTHNATSTAKHSVDLVATLDNVDRAIDFVRIGLSEQLCPSNIQHKVYVALEELTVNVCNYAYVDQPQPGMMHVSYACADDPSSITIAIVDQGIPFNPLTREDPTKPKSAQEAKIGGLGIFMVKKTMDEFTYSYDDATKSNVVTFKKYW